MTQVIDARQIDAKTLAVLTTTLKRDWAKFPHDTLSGEGYGDRFDSMLELIDLRTTRLLGKGALTGWPISISSDNTVATYQTDDDGFPVVRVWRFSAPR